MMRNTSCAGVAWTLICCVLGLRSSYAEAIRRTGELRLTDRRAGAALDVIAALDAIASLDAIAARPLRESGALFVRRCRREDQTRTHQRREPAHPLPDSELFPEHEVGCG